jgi:large-conductance mechanosensitive channel
MRKAIRKNVVGLIITSTVVFMSADYVHIQSVFVQLMNYSVLTFIVVYLTDFLRFTHTHYLFIFISLVIITLHAFLINFDILILIKYLLIIFTLAMSLSPRKSIDAHSHSFFLYPWIIILSAGLYQLIMLTLNPALVLVSEHSRPIGFSVEPTFYSQQLLMFWLMSLLFCKRVNRFLLLFLEIVTVLLIMFCATRTSMLLALPILGYRVVSQSARNLATMAVFSPFLVYYMSKINFGNLEIFFHKLNRLLNVSGEPREVAFYEMADMIGNSGLFGSGYKAVESSVGLVIGSLYGNLTMSLYYTFGILIILPLFSVVIRIIFSGLTLKSVTFGYVILLSQVMPFLFTSFGLFVWIITASASRKVQRR